MPSTIFSGLPFDLPFKGGAGFTNATPFLEASNDGVIGVRIVGVRGTDSGIGLAAILSFVGTANETRGLFNGGPPGFTDRVVFTGGLGDGGTSVTGVLGM